MDMGCVGMVNVKKTVCGIIWYVGDMVRGKNRMWYGILAVWYDVVNVIYGYICLVVWYQYVSVNRVRNGRIRRTNIICNDLIYRPSESVRKYKPCGQTDKFAITAAETQFYKLRITHRKTKSMARFMRIA